RLPGEADPVGGSVRRDRTVDGGRKTGGSVVARPGNSACRVRRRPGAAGRDRAIVPGTVAGTAGEGAGRRGPRRRGGAGARSAHVQGRGGDVLIGRRRGGPGAGASRPERPHRRRGRGGPAAGAGARRTRRGAAGGARRGLAVVRARSVSEGT